MSSFTSVATEFLFHHRLIGRQLVQIVNSLQFTLIRNMNAVVFPYKNMQVYDFFIVTCMFFFRGVEKDEFCSDISHHHKRVCKI
jgi:hypothetical protein